MTATDRPATRPQNPFFSSGPCAKRPGWSLDNLKNALLGRSHRSAAGKARLKSAIDRTRALLKLPDDYLVALVPGSDTGAVGRRRRPGNAASTVPNPTMPPPIHSHSTSGCTVTPAGGLVAAIGTPFTIQTR